MKENPYNCKELTSGSIEIPVDGSTHPMRDEKITFLKRFWLGVSAWILKDEDVFI